MLGSMEAGRQGGREVVVALGPVRHSPSHNPAKGHTNSSSFSDESPRFTVTVILLSFLMSLLLFS